MFCHASTKAPLPRRSAKRAERHSCCAVSSLLPMPVPGSFQRGDSMMRKRFSVAAIAVTMMCHLLAADLAAQGRAHGQGVGGSTGGNVHPQPDASAGPPFRPKGWGKGEKVGWGDCNQPPGLAKKSGCATESSSKPTDSADEPEDGQDDASAPAGNHDRTKKEQPTSDAPRTK